MAATETKIGDKNDKAWGRSRGKIRAVGKVTLAFRNEAWASFATYIPRILHRQLLDESYHSGAQLQFSATGSQMEAALIFSARPISSSDGVKTWLAIAIWDG